MEFVKGDEVRTVGKVYGANICALLGEMVLPMQRGADTRTHAHARIFCVYDIAKKKADR